VQVKTRLAKARQDVAAFMADVKAETDAIQADADAKYAAEVEAIMNKYPVMKPTSKRHAENVGRMIWSSEQINIDVQDRVALRDSFNLTDPIFGRMYLPRSLGNTPVGSSPSSNREFRFEIRLFIDGENKADRFGVFVQSKLNDKAGQTWTTWQFAPNPVPFNDGFKGEADAWRRTTKGLAPGSHKVRFELWGGLGQSRSREPLSVGEFILVVNEGDRIAAATPFPADSYGGGDLEAVRAAMTKAMVGSEARNSDEILKVAVTSEWKEGVYSDTKRLFRGISGVVLWGDKDGDGVCRFLTYNFISDHLGGNDWTPARFKSFCLGCPEGDAECPK
jgi:hypothetical protein